MAHKNLFRSWLGKMAPATDTLNEAGAPAYKYSPRHALAQYAATGCFNTTYYATAEEQLSKVMELCEQVDAEFIARTAVFCRQRGLMKDMPALLCGVLSVKNPALLSAIFDRVIDDGKMLRNFVQIMRSGAVGRKSLGTRPKKLVLKWLAERSDEAIFRAAVGNDPSLSDVIRMVHPKPTTKEREALYGYLLRREHDASRLPAVIQRFEDFKATKHGEVPDVPFQMLAGLDLGAQEWTAIAKKATWQTTRMNLNTFARHGVFDVDGMAELIAARLSDAQAVGRARVFPYQLMTAFTMAGAEIPEVVREALQDAMDHALKNVPTVNGKVYVLPDVSGSMSSPVTGHRKGATTSVRCIDVAALVAAAILRRNPNAEVLPFAESVKPVEINRRDAVMTNATKLASLGGGGTNCSAPLAQLNQWKAKGELVVFVSDNESWVDARRGRGTATLVEWEAFKVRNPKAKLVCIDIQPYGNTQAAERNDILNVGGFSDQVFEVMHAFAQGEINPNHWVGIIDQVKL